MSPTGPGSAAGSAGVTLPASGASSGATAARRAPDWMPLSVADATKTNFSAIAVLPREWNADDADGADWRGSDKRREKTGPRLFLSVRSALIRPIRVIRVLFFRPDRPVLHSQLVEQEGVHV